MRPDDILEWTRAKPFVPFRIRLNSGRTFDIRHPEMIRLSRTTMYVFTFTGAPDELVERMEMVGLLLIETIEPLEPSRSS